MRLLWLLGACGAILAWLRPKVFRVAGASMSPSLREGTLVLTVRPFSVLVRDGSVVTLPDPREPSRLLIKRVAARLDDLLDVRGDNSDASTDSRAFGLQRITALAGVLVLPRLNTDLSR